METQRARTISLSLRDVSVLLLVAVLIAGSFMQQRREPVASAETRFTETSSGGLAIVPASCPSSPHYSGECSGGQRQEGVACTIWANVYGITSGGSATLSWGATNGIGTETGSISPTIGSVNPLSGSQSVSPTVTTTYTFTVDYGGETCTSDLTITVSQGDVCANVSGNQSTAPENGYVLENGDCACVSGYYLSGGQCLPETETSGCTAQYFCTGNTLSYRDSQCAESTVQACSYACSAGACILPPQGQGNITVTPGLVRSGETTTVAWTSADMNSCTVTESNPNISDSWTGTTGSQTSSAITEQTSYTLLCNVSGGGTFTDRATVNIIPTFCETDAQGNCPGN